MKTFVDVETRSELDISAGSHNYSKHPSTRVLCIALSNEDGDVAVYDLMQNTHWPKEWENAVKRDDEIVAHNVAFEYEMLTNNLGHWPQPHPEMWRDTQAKCLCAGFPAKLGSAAKALKLDDLKDEAGAALINFFCKPVPTGGEAGKFREPADHAERWKLMMEYCRQDVVTMMAVDKALPDLSDDELAFWLATWDQNRRGVAIDVDLVRSLSLMVVAGRLAIADRLEDFDFDDLSNHRKVLKHVQDTGLAIDSVAKARVKEALALDIPEAARSVLEARQAAGKTSVSKLDALLSQVGADGRLRHTTRAHGTTTGRDCLAEGTLILVKRAGEVREVPIEGILDLDLLWDGVGWVSHGGLIYKGEADVIYHDGITGTPDHIVFTGVGSESLREARLAGRSIQRA